MYIKVANGGKKNIITVLNKRFILFVFDSSKISYGIAIRVFVGGKTYTIIESKRQHFFVFENSVFSSFLFSFLFLYSTVNIL